VSQFELKH